MTHLYSIMDSPVGSLYLIVQNDHLKAITWGAQDFARIKMDPSIELAPQNPLLRETEKQLHAYFSGTLCNFDLPLDADGTAFQKQVWDALTTIPYGETRSYAQIATQIDNPKAVRAVGMTNSKNPISIIVPCHRVIGANGTLTGYAGGLDKKTFLLDLEKRLTR
jgi:methylated-DNA-[protein]-cysteine S-methyltransferase